MPRKPKQHKSDGGAETITAATLSTPPVNDDPPPKRKRGVSVSGDLRECIENAFHEAGGRDYLVWVARRRPDVFVQLIGKIIPTEARLTVLAGYQAMPVPVEVRDALPGATVTVALPAAVLDESPEQESPLIADSDWLLIP
jgi:hypothetical protein